ncbi:hypothetical protein LRD69_14100 [Streptomyces sp. JH14]|uniref:hypothetical protein n=1 Tax=Streptomyces sp. JH14 TaxID=2793630 RepID=UPI0023F796E3|nr:hypothetical protein [Streptomyces sp. JH14]MDF6043261.1 hypothetical protein [Streptomyces sp. JH14]
MPTAGDQLPGGATDLARRLAALEREVRELRAARRLENASVGAGGVRVVDGGRFAMDTPAKKHMVDIGAITNDDYNHGDGTRQQGIFLRREDGSPMLSCFSYPPFGSEAQAWKFYDNSGSVVLAEDANSGAGLARPYLPVALAPAYGGAWDYWPRTSATTMTELWGGRIYKQQPRIVVVVRASMDTSGATGSIGLKISDVSQPSQSVGFAVGYYTLGPYSLANFEHMQQVDITVEAKRDSGTGTIRASLFSAYTIQS